MKTYIGAIGTALLMAAAIHARAHSCGDSELGVAKGESSATGIFGFGHPNADYTVIDAGDPGIALIAPLSETNVPLLQFFSVFGVEVGVTTMKISVVHVDGAPESMVCTIQVTVVEGYDIELRKTATPTPATLGEDLTYTLDLVNHGPAASGDFGLDESLPPPNCFTVTSVSATSGTCEQDLFGPNTLLCGISNLAVGATVTVTVVGTPLMEGVLTNVASISGQFQLNSSNDFQFVETPVVPPKTPTVDLTVAKTCFPQVVGRNVPFSYLITIGNNGPGDAENVQFVDTLPGNVTVNFTLPPSPVCQLAGNVLTCNLGDLPAGATTQIVIDAQSPDASVILTNAAQASALASTESNPADNQTAITNVVTKVADLVVTKTDSLDPVEVGQTFTYFLVVSNKGPNTAENVFMADDMPFGLEFLFDLDVNCDMAQPPVLACSYASLAAGAAIQVSMVVRAHLEGTVTNFVSGLSDVFDPNLADNSDTENTSVTIPPDTDGDGIPDYWESEHFMTPTNAIPEDDSDNDGQDNLDEFIGGTSPTNGADSTRIREFILRTNEFEAGFGTKPGRRYRVQETTNELNRVPQEWTTVTNKDGFGQDEDYSWRLTNEPPRKSIRLQVEKPN